MKYLISLIMVGLGFILVKPVYAHCPLCVAGAGAGLSLSRVLGIDDSITGIWMGGFLGSMGMWFDNVMKKKYIIGQKILIYIFMFVSTILSFYRFGLVNEHNGLLLNLPKLIFGIILGGVLFYLMDVVNKVIKEKNGGVLFDFQPIVFSLGAMILASGGMYGLLNYYI